MPELKMVPIDQLTLSRFNARRHRPETHIVRLAERIKRNGFEVSRALWVYAMNGHYEVFAGGTRLAAAQEAALQEVPVLLYPAEDEGLISRLADEDNENDEYHMPVPLPDIWAEYKRLKDEEKWTGKAIAEAKGVNAGTVSQRCRFATFPLKVIEAFFKYPALQEDHARVLLDVLKFKDLSPWLTQEQAQEEIMSAILERHRGKEGLAPTASVFRKYVETYNQLDIEAHKALRTFPEPFQTVGAQATLYNPDLIFLCTLHQKKVRTAKDVTLVGEQELAHCRYLQQQIQAHHTRQAEEAEAEQARIAEEEARQAHRNALLRCLVHGDCRDLLSQCPAPIHLVVTDPPYGIGFQSHRRVTTARKSQLINDNPEAILPVIRDMVALLKPKLAPDAHIILFTHQDTYALFQQTLRDAGFSLRRTMTWDKGTHGLGDITRGEVLTQTEWIIHAVQGNPKFEDEVARPEILTFPVTQDSELPTEKPLDLLSHLITLASAPGSLVVDPFAGSGHTLLAALRTGRRGWACEVDTDTYTVASQRLYAYVEEYLHAQ